MSAVTRRDALGAALGALGLGVGAQAPGAPAPRRPALPGEHAGALPFYASKQLLAFRPRAEIYHVFDFFSVEMRGYTPKAKCKRLGSDLGCLYGVIQDKVTRNYTPRWMVCHPALAAWLKAHSERARFTPSPLPPDKVGVAYLGVHLPQLRLYHDPDYPMGEVLVGLGTGDLPKENLGRIRVDNFTG